MSNINQDFIDFIQTSIPSNTTIDAFLSYCNKPLRTSIRINTLKISVDKFITHMQSKGWIFEQIPWLDSGFWISGHNEEKLGNSIEHLQGLFYIQEASSMLPPTALFSNELQGNSILDVAAAPGSKTTQIAACMQNEGLLIANEYSSSRVKVLHANLVRMGVMNAVLTHFDGCVFGEYLYETFDGILLDAPCSGEGTIRKDPNALKNWQLSDIEVIVDVQKELIDSAFLALKPGGTLIYSTCTLNTLENQQVCHYLKNKYPNAVSFNSLENLFANAQQATTSEGFLHVWPQIFDSEGFFIASITKLASVPRNDKEPKPQKNFPFKAASQNQAQTISDYFKERLNILLPENHKIMIKDQEFWLFPADFEKLIGKMRFQRIGIKLAEQVKKHLKIKHEAIIALAKDTSKFVELTSEQARNYLMGRDILLDDKPKQDGEVIVSYLNVPLGLAKSLPNKLKNNLPRELVRDEACIS